MDKIKTRDYTLSWIRGVSMLMIILCHLAQYFNHRIAWWLNVGVQIFFVLSGYLYANRKITDRISFIKRRFCRILIDYFLFVVPAVILYWIFARQIISVHSTLDILFAHGTIDGLGHLWFIPYILVCYVITPLLHDVLYQVEGHQAKVNYLLSVLLILIVVHIVVSLFASYFNPAWINAYILGMVVGRTEKKYHIEMKRYAVPSTVLTFVALSVQFLTRLHFQGELQGELELGLLSYYQACRDYGHTLLGVSLFIWLKCIFGELKLCGGGAKLSLFIDRFSYDIYLVHHIFILGPFSLMGVFHLLPLNVILIICLSIVCAITLERASYATRLLLTKELKRIGMLVSVGKKQL